MGTVRGDLVSKLRRTIALQRKGRLETTLCIIVGQTIHSKERSMSRSELVNSVVNDEEVSEDF